MKILISTGRLAYRHNANTKIAMQVAKCLCAQGHEVILCGECFEEEAQTAPSAEGAVQLAYFYNAPLTAKSMVELRRFTAQEKFAENRIAARRAFMLRHPIFAALQWRFYSPHFTGPRRMAAYGRQVVQLAQKIGAEHMICICFPFEYITPVMENARQAGIPTYYWQLDPWGLHCDANIHPPLTNAERIRQETAAFELTTHIFTTPVLRRQYEESPDYRRFADKMTAVEFPNVCTQTATEGQSPVFAFDSKAVNLIYCGLMHDGYRSPAFLLQSLGALIEQGVPIRMYFVGEKNSDAVDDALKKYPQHVFYHSSVPVGQAFATMQAADVLVNLGSIYSNQVPSKIFDYFSLGKPVLSVQKIADCPAHTYLARYPLAFILREAGEKAEPEVLAQLHDFLQKSRGQSLPCQKVRELFADCTPEYVAGQFEDVLSGKA